MRFNDDETKSQQHSFIIDFSLRDTRQKIFLNDEESEEVIVRLSRERWINFHFLENIIIGLVFHIMNHDHILSKNASKPKIRWRTNFKKTIKANWRAIVYPKTELWSRPRSDNPSPPFWIVFSKSCPSFWFCLKRPLTLGIGSPFLEDLAQVKKTGWMRLLIDQLGVTWEEY